jgi:peptidoglycan/LPS O-acetylase OafA/YrhL
MTPCPVAAITEGDPVAAEEASGRSRVRWVDVDRLRAVAILLILFLHAVAGGAYLVDGSGSLTLASAIDQDAFRWAQRLVEVALHGATITLTLISGALYARVFASRSIHAFHRSRMRNVVVPYLVVSTLLSAYSWLPGEAPRLKAAWTLAYAARIASRLLLGTAEFQLWYIPVLVILFALSPVLHALATRPELGPLAVMVILAPLVVSRTDLHLTPSQVVYFAGPYLLGMVLGGRPAALRDAVARHLAALGVVVGATSAVLLASWSERPARFAFFVPQESLFYVQKVALSALLLHLCGSPMDRLPGWARGALDWTASRSLALYLLHITVLTPYLCAASYVFGPVVSFGGWLGLVLAAFAAMLLTVVAVIAGAQRMAGARSRLLIGA